MMTHTQHKKADRPYYSSQLTFIIIKTITAITTIKWDVHMEWTSSSTAAHCGEQESRLKQPLHTVTTKKRGNTIWRKTGVNWGGIRDAAFCRGQMPVYKSSGIETGRKGSIRDTAFCRGQVPVYKSPGTDGLEARHPLWVREPEVWPRIKAHPDTIITQSRGYPARRLSLWGQCKDLEPLFCHWVT